MGVADHGPHFLTSDNGIDVNNSVCGLQNLLQGRDNQIMSETASFVDPVFLARFGLQRANVIDYFLHPLNPFRATVNTSNDVLAMQGITIGILMQQGLHGEPLTPAAAEEEYQASLTKLTGEQYELRPPPDPVFYMQPSPLYTLRHVLRTSPSSIKILGVYYVIEVKS